MADIRIKDLTTPASSTASDDFIAVDGTTNGTRKLNAFSPTFGGNATVGGTLTVSGVATASSGLVIGSGSFAEGKLYYGAFGGLTIAAKTGSSYDLYIAAPDGNAIGYVPTGTKTLTLASTTASTGTSSGALVVSGGVGVAGAINAGVGTHTFATSSGGGYNNFGPLLTAINVRSTSDSDNPIFRVLDSRVNASAFEVNTRTGNTLLAGNITTAAPTGGTAAAWKLGTVASVSPTSPNRTIEVDIGGTIYYIHAKTTNN